MLRRAAASRTRGVAAQVQRRTCMDKWYGHLVEVMPSFDWGDECPHDGYKGRKRTPVEVAMEIKTMPAVEFCSTWEIDNMERPRYWFDDQNPPVYDFWAPSALELRCNREVDRNLVARAAREIPAGASDVEKDRMMNDIHEEELVTKDDRMMRARNVNWFAHCNMVDILPDPLREKVRLDLYEELHLHDRQEIRGILREWIPLKYRLDPAPDSRKMAIDSEEHKAKFLAAIKKVNGSFSGEASGTKAQALAEMTDFYTRQYGKVDHITEASIKKASNIKSVEQAARDLFYYNGSKLIYSCWRRAAELRKEPSIADFANITEAEYFDQVIDFSIEEREFYELFLKSIPMTEKEFLMKQMAENPVLEETLKHSSDIHILEEIEAFYNEHVDAEKEIVDALVSEASPEAAVAAMSQIEAQSNAHFVAARKYKTLATELSILANKEGLWAHELASFREKIKAFGSHFGQPNAPYQARVVLGLRLFDVLLAIEPHFPEEELPSTAFVYGGHRKREGVRDIRSQTGDHM